VFDAVARRLAATAGMTGGLAKAILGCQCPRFIQFRAEVAKCSNKRDEFAVAVQQGEANAELIRPGDKERATMVRIFASKQRDGASVELTQ
jgi:hypothetical protein